MNSEKENPLKRLLHRIENFLFRNETERAERAEQRAERKTEKGLSENRRLLGRNSIVGTVLAPSEGEIPIRQYRLAKYLYYPRLLFATGRLEITNRRIIYRISGNSFFGPILYHYEYDIRRISGININSGRRISIPRFILTLLILNPLLLAVTDILTDFIFSIFMGENYSALPLAVYWLLCIGLFILSFFMAEHRTLQMLLSDLLLSIAGFGTGFHAVLDSYVMEEGKSFWASLGAAFMKVFVLDPQNMVFLVVSLIFIIAACYRFSMRKNISLTVLSTFPSGAPIELAGTKNLLLSALTVTLFGEDAQQAIMETGAIIQDLHTMGDAAVRKWHDTDPTQWKRMNQAYRRNVFPAGTPVSEDGMPAEAETSLADIVDESGPAASAEKSSEGDGK